MTKLHSSALVTVICTCYNHEHFVEEAIYSVLNQTYPNIQLIVVDNASQDNSVAIINKLTAIYSEIEFIKHETNLGICKAFNNASKIAKGKYLIDLAADDLLCPDRIKLQVDAFEKLPNTFGILYSNVEEIDANGKHLRFTINEHIVPSGYIFSNLLEKHFIPSPSTIFKKEVFDSLNGYNDQLAFEDFDFWVRCSRTYQFQYLDIVSTKKRILRNSLSSQFKSRQSDRMLTSTFQTFLWASNHLKNEVELKSLAKGASYYFRQSVLWGHFETATKFKNLAALNSSLKDQICKILYYLKFDISFFYQFLVR